MNSQKLFAGLAAVGIVLITRSLDAASLYGDTVSAKWSYDSSPATFEFSGTAVVGPGTEFVTQPSSGYVNEADFAESSVTVRYRRTSATGTFSAKHWFFEGLDWLPPTQILNVAPAPGNPVGATVSNIGSNSFRIGLPRLSVTSPTIVSWSFNILTVPEPSSAGLCSMMVLASLARRRQINRT